MRFQYNPPNELLLLADAFYIYSWDPDLKQMSKVGLKSTPAWFLLRQPISFTDGVVVTRFEHSGNTVRVTVVESGEPDAGSLTMVFTENPLVLRQWTVVDQQGKVTNVALSEVQYGMALDAKLFQYQDPYARKNDDR
jgi:outer membrane lipoprotein-sorting protein